MAESGLSPAEELVAAVKAGEELDLTERPELERMLPASDLREILLGRIVDEPGARAVRLRGAVIVGDLDLSHVRTGMIVELTNCHVTRICLDGASIPRFSLRETDPEKPRWLETAFAWGGRIGKEPALITALLFGFVVIKVVWIARGDIPTALGVFNSAGLASVIAGGLLSALPVVSAVVFGVATFELSRSWPFIKTFPFIRRRDAPVWLIGLAAAVGCFFLTPWPIMVWGAGLGLLSRLAVWVVRKVKKLAGDKHKWIGKQEWIGKAVELGAIAVLALLSLFLVLNPLLYAVWLPHETLTLAKPRGQQMVGYVLSDSNGWVSVLRTQERHIYRFRSENVTARVLCSATPVPMPFAPDWFKSPSPLYKILRPGASTTLPPCS